MRSLDLDIYNISLINCNQLFADTISSNIVNDLHQFELLDKGISHVDIRKITYHHIIYSLCEEILHSNNNKKVLFFNYTQLVECDMLKFFDEQDVLKIISATLKYIRIHLPIRIYISKYSLAHLDHLIIIDDARGSITVNDILKKINITFDKFNFRRIKKFTDKYNLTFLNDDYFNRLSTKLLLTK